MAVKVVESIMQMILRKALDFWETKITPSEVTSGAL
jgi:hypothetical protein